MQPSAPAPGNGCPAFEGRRGAIENKDGSDAVEEQSAQDKVRWNTYRRVSPCTDSLA